MAPITKLRITIAAVTLSALAAGALWLLVPAPEGADTGVFYSPFGTPTTFVDLILAIGGGALFIRALKAFKNELRPAWLLIAVAQIALGLLTLVFPVVEYYYLWDNVWWNMATYLPYLVGSIFMYLGIRKFYRILGLKSHITSVVLVGGVIMAAWAIHALIPHPVTWQQFSERQYDLFEILPLIPIILYICSTYMAYLMRAKVGAEYKRAFQWLTVGLGLQAFSTIAIGVLELVGYENWYFASRAYEVPTIVGDMGILAAAYYFNAIGLQTNHTTVWSFLSGKRKHTATSLDILTYVSGMSSDPSKIDKYLDVVRFISSNHTPGQLHSTAEQQQLADVYLHVEQFLTSGESLRTFDTPSLRSHIVDYFKLDEQAAKQTFWPYIQAKTR